MRFGILGGSFNPPHRGHLALATTVLDLGLVDAVTFIPAAVPPHKAAPTQADAETRLAMTSLLAKERPGLCVDDLELRRSGPSFSVDTVRELQANCPTDNFRLIIGSDMGKTFATWREFRELLRIAPPLVAERPDSVFAGTLEEMYPGMSMTEIRVMETGRFYMKPMDVSSTMVRAKLAEGAGDAEMLGLLTRPVLSFIRERGLYKPVMPPAPDAPAPR